MTERLTPEAPENPHVVGIGPGIEAGAWAHVALAMEADKKGDRNLLKSIARGIIRPAFLQSLSDRRFLFPQHAEKRGMVMVPAMDWIYTQMAMAEDPALADAMRGMREDWSPEKWPNGGARYENVYAKAGSAALADGSANSLFGSVPVNSEYSAEFLNPDGSLRNRKYLAQILQAVSEDTIANVRLGGNSMLSFHREIADWALNGRYGEGRSLLPAKELVRFYVEMSRSATGRAQLSNLLGSTSHVQEINSALSASGFTYFVDVLGQRHDLNVREIITSGERADIKLQAMYKSGQAVPPPAPIEIG